MTRKTKDATASSRIKSILYKADASNREEVVSFVVQNGFTSLQFGEIISGSSIRNFPNREDDFALGVSFALSPGDQLQIFPENGLPNATQYNSNRRFKVISE